MQELLTQDTGRKIIHVDMDCFYAAIEVRDNPQLKGKPVAVGGASDRRGVLCTCNYEARKFGVKSAMPTSRALSLCRDLIVLPVNFDKYRQASRQIHEVFQQYTQQIEPLSLDEAFLDVSNAPHCDGSAILIAQRIRHDIFERLRLTASAGIANNKMLAKIASDWNKPNGQFAITPDEVANFIRDLPVKKLFGVGKVTAGKMQDMQINTCSDLQKLNLDELHKLFGKFGQQLFQMCRGIDHRAVVSHRERKSLSTEETFAQDLPPDELPLEILQYLYRDLHHRLEIKPELNAKIKSIFVKIKFADFSTTTIQKTRYELDFNAFKQLFQTRQQEHQKAIRLIGFGVHFYTDADIMQNDQLLLEL